MTCEDIAPAAGTAWGDLLTAYDGNAITYDGIGNPLTWGNRTFTWEHGRHLASLTENGTTWTYTYDANGMRTSRTDGTTTYSYVYNGSQLVQMTVGEDTLRFAYDAAGTPLSVNYNGTTYYYVTDIQGDVVAIVNASGVKLVEYTYSSWGVVLDANTTTSEMLVEVATILGNINPLLYRGYVYDIETGLYYLQSRYYDPVVSRFINADAYVATGQGFIGNNMFAYCLNNPIVFADYDGRETTAIGWWLSCFGWLVVADGPAMIGDAIVILGILIVGVSVPERQAQVAVPPQFLEEEKKDDKGEDVDTPNVTYPGDDSSKAPEGTEWKGKGEQGSKQGNYYNPETGESWHPDLDHPEPIGPHWDYRDPSGIWWRIGPGDCVTLK